jgi:hypothetical protein
MSKKNDRKPARMEAPGRCGKCRWMAQSPEMQGSGVGLCIHDPPTPVGGVIPVPASVLEPNKLRPSVYSEPRRPPVHVDAVGCSRFVYESRILSVEP